VGEHDDLTARLRRSLDYSGYFAPLHTEATDRLDALEAEVERLRGALFDLAWKVRLEADGRRHGQPRYDMTLDDLAEHADAALAVLADSEGGDQ